MEHIKQMYFKPEPSYEVLDRPEQIHAYIESFREPATNLCKQLYQRFTANTYSTLLGLDSSGRVPSLILNECVKELAIQDPSIKVPNLIFQNPHFLLPLTESDIQSLGHVLIVDDTLEKGTSLRQATKELRNNDVPFDIAIFVAYNSDEAARDQLANYLDAGAITVGIEDYVSDGVFDEEAPKHPHKDKAVNGVVRNGSSTHHDKDNQPDINIARAEIKILAKSIVESLQNK